MNVPPLPYVITLLYVSQSARFFRRRLSCKTVTRVSPVKPVQTRAKLCESALKCSGMAQAQKIYFCGSIRGGRDDVHVYQRIVHALRTYGTVLTEHVTDGGLTDTGEISKSGDKQIHDRDLDWLRQSHVVVAEVTQPSLGVGYELGRAVDLNKPVLCLFRPESGRRLSAMIRGAADGQKFVVQDYTQDQVESILNQFFSQIKI